MGWSRSRRISETTKRHPSYFDGVKYIDSYSVGDFAATLTAFTYPDEFLEFEGMRYLGAGVIANDQPSKVFGLTYRTWVGNAVEGRSLGYQIHLLYNLIANPNSVSYQTLEDQTQAMNFTWTLASVPEVIPNFRPTAHVFLDSQVLAC